MLDDVINTGKYRVVIKKIGFDAVSKLSNAQLVVYRAKRLIQRLNRSVKLPFSLISRKRFSFPYKPSINKYCITGMQRGDHSNRQLKEVIKTTDRSQFFTWISVALFFQLSRGGSEVIILKLKNSKK